MSQALTLHALGQASFESLAEIPSYAEHDLDVSLENFISRMFARVGDSLRNSMQNLKNLPPVEKAIGDRKRFQAVIAKYQYMDLEALNFSVPEGLQVDYLTYSDLVLQSLTHTQKISEETLAPFRKFLSGVVSDPTVKFDARNDLLKAFRVRAKEREALHRALLGCFKDSMVKIVPYGQAISRNSDWDSVFGKIEQGGKVANFDHKLLSNEVDEVVELVKVVSSLATEDPSFKQLHGAALGQLTELTTLAAEEVAFIAVSYYYSASLFTNLSFSVKDLIEKLR